MRKYAPVSQKRKWTAKDCCERRMKMKKQSKMSRKGKGWDGMGWGIKWTQRCVPRCDTTECSVFEDLMSSRAHESRLDTSQTSNSSIARCTKRARRRDALQSNLCYSLHSTVIMKLVFFVQMSATCTSNMEHERNSGCDTPSKLCI